jgi:hypothetical protein
MNSAKAVFFFALFAILALLFLLDSLAMTGSITLFVAILLYARLSSPENRV